MSTGRFVWFDLMTPDVAAARAFYAGLFDWDVQAHGPSYAMIHVAGRACGGIAARPASFGPGCWVPYVSTDAIGETVDTAEEIGGKLYMRQRAPGVGEFAVLADRQGAVFATIQLENEAPRPPLVKGRDEISWAELHTDDPRDALDFYVALFGWSHASRDAAYTFLGDQHDAGMLAAMEGVPPHWLLYANVADADAKARAVTAFGGTVLHGPTDLPGVGRFLVFRDPTGGVFAAMESRS